MNREEAFSKLSKPNIDDKVLLLTHIDMDAAGAELLCKWAFKKLTVKHLSNSKMSQGILDYVKYNVENKEYDMIIIDDISCSIEVADDIDKIKNSMKIVLLDHHDTAVALNKYDWALVSSGLLEDSFMAGRYKDISKAHSSGASLMYDYLSYNGVLTATDFIKEITHLIAAYDTWDWNYLLGKDEKYSTLDKLCDIYGLERFVDEMLCRALMDSTINSLFNGKDIKMLEEYEEKVNEYLDGIKEYLVDSELTLDSSEKLSVVWCFTTNYLQETFALMKESFPGRDLYLINYGTGIALRTDNQDIHVGNFARERYGGGGHPGAAGFGMSQEIKKKCLEVILGGTINNKEN